MLPLLLGLGAAIAACEAHLDEEESGPSTERMARMVANDELHNSASNGCPETGDTALRIRHNQSIQIGPSPEREYYARLHLLLDLAHHRRATILDLSTGSGRTSRTHRQTC